MNRCQFSSLTIPNDRSYFHTAGVYAAKISEIFGLKGKEVRAVADGVKQALDELSRQAFGPSERGTIDVCCERTPMGLKIILKDKGLPFGEEVTTHIIKPGETIQTKPAMFKDSDFWDEVSLHNLGSAGKETHLVKYIKGSEKYYKTCGLEWSEHPSAFVSLSYQNPFHIRPMEPSEAVEVSRCFYRAYGYSFVHKQVYYPDGIIELNKSGEIFSAVAVTKDNEIIGHCALLNWGHDPRVAEIGLAVVKPEYRRQGCLNKLTKYLIEKARSDKIEGLFVLAATNHTHSQKVIHKLGFGDCGLLVGFGPASLSFRGISEKLLQRESYLVCARFLAQPSKIVYVPEHHQEFIGNIYRNIGIEPDIRVPDSVDLKYSQHPSVIRRAYYSPSGYGRIEIDEIGSDLVSEVKTALKSLLLKQIEIIQLHLDLTNPLTYELVMEFEEMGFFVCGVRPGATKGDLLILQYLNNVLIDYSKIKIASEEGIKIRDYIEAHDPNQFKVNEKVSYQE